MVELSSNSGSCIDGADLAGGANGVCCDFTVSTKGVSDCTKDGMLDLVELVGISKDGLKGVIGTVPSVRRGFLCVIH